MEQKEDFPSQREKQSEDVLSFFASCLHEYSSLAFAKAGEERKQLLKQWEQTMATLVYNKKTVQLIASLPSAQTVRTVALSLVTFFAMNTYLFAGETIDATITSSISWVKVSAYAVIVGTGSLSYALKKKTAYAMKSDRQNLLKNIDMLQPLFPENMFMLKRMKNTVKELVDRRSLKALIAAREVIQQYYTDIVFNQKGIVLRLLNTAYAPQSEEKEKIEELLMLHTDKTSLLAAQKIIFTTLYQKGTEEPEQQKVQQLSEQVDTLIYMLEHIDIESSILLKNIDAIEQKLERKKRKKMKSPIITPVVQGEEIPPAPSPQAIPITTTQQDTQEQIEKFISLSPLPPPDTKDKAQIEEERPTQNISASSLPGRNEEQSTVDKTNPACFVSQQATTSGEECSPETIREDMLPSEILTAEEKEQGSTEMQAQHIQQEEGDKAISSVDSFPTLEREHVTEKTAETAHPSYQPERRTLPLLDINAILSVTNNILPSQEAGKQDDIEPMGKELPSLPELEERFQKSGELYGQCHKRERRIMTQLNMEDRYEKYQNRIMLQMKKITTLLQKNKRLKKAIEKNNIPPAILESDAYATYAKLVSGIRKDLEQWEKILMTWRKILLSKTAP